MKVEDLIEYMNQRDSYIVNIRCNECLTIVMSKKGETFWHTLHIHSCWDKIEELEISDERELGGTVGLLVTVGGKE